MDPKPVGHTLLAMGSIAHLAALVVYVLRIPGWIFPLLAGLLLYAIGLMARKAEGGSARGRSRPPGD